MRPLLLARLVQLGCSILTIVRRLRPLHLTLAFIRLQRDCLPHGKRLWLFKLLRLLLLLLILPLFFLALLVLRVGAGLVHCEHVFICHICNLVIFARHLLLLLVMLTLDNLLSIILFLPHVHVVLF